MAWSTRVTVQAHRRWDARVNRTGFRGGWLVDCSSQGWGSLGLVILRLELGWGKVAERLEQPRRVEPRDPFQRRELHVLEPAPRTRAVDHLRPVQADHALAEGVIVAVPSAAD